MKKPPPARHITAYSITPGRIRKGVLPVLSGDIVIRRNEISTWSLTINGNSTIGTAVPARLARLDLGHDTGSATCPAHRGRGHRHRGRTLGRCAHGDDLRRRRLHLDRSGGYALGIRAGVPRGRHWCDADDRRLLRRRAAQGPSGRCSSSHSSRTKSSMLIRLTIGFRDSADVEYPSELPRQHGGGQRPRLWATSTNH